MDNITKVKTQFRQEQQVKLIKECQNSGLTVREWCKHNNITEHTYYYWLRRIRKSACERLPYTKNEISKPVVFAPIGVKEKTSSILAPIIIHLQNVDVEVRDGSSLQTLEMVLSALKSIC